MSMELESILATIASTLIRIESKLNPEANPKECDFDEFIACSWKKNDSHAFLQGIEHPKLISLSDLVDIEQQKALIVRNTEQFLNSLPCNNVLLWGAKGTGKSSIIKALLHAYADRGLRVVEVDRADLVDIPEITGQLRNSKYRFIIFCDDLSFEAADVSYKALKVTLDGGMSAIPENVIIYATSNRRHLLPEMMVENNQTRIISGEVHYSDGMEEKISLSERFGLCLSFYPFNDTEYLKIAHHWINSFGFEYTEAIAVEAIQWSRLRASKSGRCAWQFALDFAGRNAIQNKHPL